jgi:hypothetical protein
MGYENHNEEQYRERRHELHEAAKTAGLDFSLKLMDNTADIRRAAIQAVHAKWGYPPHLLCSYYKVPKYPGILMICVS